MTFRSGIELEDEPMETTEGERMASAGTSWWNFGRSTKENNVVAMVREPVVDVAEVVAPSKGEQIYIGRADTREEWIPANMIVIPVEYQRALYMPWVKEIARKFDMRKFTKMHVNRRADGTIVVLDGQHRLAALRLKYGDGAELRLQCEVHRLPTIEEEATLFLALNHDIRRTDAKATFPARLASGDDTAVTLRDIARKHGYTLHSGGGRPSRNHLYIAPFERIRKLHGERAWVPIDGAMGIIREVYGEHTDELPSTVITAISSFWAAFYDHPKVDRKHLVRVLSGQGSNKLLRDVKDVAAALRKSEGYAGKTVLLQLYNYKKTTHRLPEHD